MIVSGAGCFSCKESGCPLEQGSSAAIKHAVCKLNPGHCVVAKGLTGVSSASPFLHTTGALGQSLFCLNLKHQDLQLSTVQLYFSGLITHGGKSRKGFVLHCMRAAFPFPVPRKEVSVVS